MNTLFTITENYLEYCKNQKGLDQKTIKAYRTDLNQFMFFFNTSNIHTILKTISDTYIKISNQKQQKENLLP